MTIHYDYDEVNKFGSIGPNCRPVMTFRSDDAIVSPLKIVERTFFRNMSDQFISMSSKEPSKPTDEHQPEEKGHRCPFGRHGGQRHGCGGHRESPPTWNYGWGFYRHRPQALNVLDAEDEEESADAEKDIKPLTPEEKKQLKRQFRRFILSRKHGGPRAFRRKLFHRLWTARKGAKYGFGGFGNPSPCHGFGGPYRGFGFGFSPHKFDRPCHRFGGPYYGFGFGFKSHKFGGLCHGFGGPYNGFGFGFKPHKFGGPYYGFGSPYGGFGDPGFRFKPYKFGEPCRRFGGPYGGFGGLGFRFKPHKFGGLCHRFSSPYDGFGGTDFGFKPHKFGGPCHRFSGPYGGFGGPGFGFKPHKFGGLPPCGAFGGFGGPSLCGGFDGFGGFSGFGGFGGFGGLPPYAGKCCKRAQKSCGGHEKSGDAPADVPALVKTD
jgi:hypothetical protein